MTSEEFGELLGVSKNSQDGYEYRGIMPKHEYCLKVVELSGLNYYDLFMNDVDLSKVGLSPYEKISSPLLLGEPEANYNRPKMMLSEIEILRKFEEIELRLSIIERKINIKD